MDEQLVRQLAAYEQVLSAIAFYADQETYHAVAFLFDPPCGEFDDDFEEDHGHPDYERPMPGKRARAALKAWSDATHG
jgi:hypothetical protein